MRECSFVNRQSNTTKVARQVRARPYLRLYVQNAAFRSHDKRFQRCCSRLLPSSIDDRRATTDGHCHADGANRPSPSDVRARQRRGRRIDAEHVRIVRLVRTEDAGADLWQAAQRPCL